MADLEQPGNDGRIPYLSAEDSALYEKVRFSADTKDQTIKRLLEDVAGASRAAHRASRY